MIRLTASIIALLILSGCSEAVVPESRKTDNKEAENRQQESPEEENRWKSLPSDTYNPWAGGGGPSSNDDNF
ncbi:MAG: hypothetical protein ACU837_00580 [Gammaproteobacteria bacterium]